MLITERQLTWRPDRLDPTAPSVQPDATTAGAPRLKPRDLPPTRRRIELRYLTFGNGIRRAIECHEDGDGRTATLPTTLAMAPPHRFQLTSGDKAHRAAQAAALELFAHGDPRIDRY